MSYHNEAPWDRAVRIAVGVVVLYLGWLAGLPGLWGAAARVFGFVPLVTGIIGWSPLYAIFDLSTRQRRPRAERAVVRR